MKINIKFDSLSREEKIELTKEVLTSQDEDVRRLIAAKNTKRKECEDCNQSKIDECLMDIAKIANNNRLAEYVRYNKIPKKVLDEFAKSAQDEVKIAIVDGVNFSLELLYEVLKNASIKVKVGIAKSKNMPLAELMKLFKSDSDAVRRAVGYTENEEMLRFLSESEASEIRKIVAANRKIPKDVLVKLSKDKCVHVRYEVAKNPNTPIEVLKELSEKEAKNSKVRIGLAKNPSSTIEILETLVKVGNEISYELHEAIINNPNVTAELIDVIAKAYLEQEFYRATSKELFVIRAIVKCKKTSRITKRKIRENPNKEISKFARMTN